MPHDVLIRSAQPGDCGWILQAHGTSYSRDFGFNRAFEALVAEVIAGFLAHHDPRREAAWVAVDGTRRVGSVLCTAVTASRAQLRLLLVTPEAQGRGVGAALVTHCLRFAQGAGYESIELWTNDVLTDARRLYERFGFQITERTPHNRFGPPMVGETWVKDFDGRATAATSEDG
ncbi:MAG: GNAT family N-acetyltransferase [Nocardioidaceae bacterium]